MYKITKGDVEVYENTYEKAERIYKRMGDGYCLMRCGGKRIEQALK